MKNFILILCLATFSQWVYAQNKLPPHIIMTSRLP